MPSSRRTSATNATSATGSSPSARMKKDGNELCYHLPPEGQARAEQGARPHRRQERAVHALPQPARVAGRSPPQRGRRPALLPVPRQGGLRAEGRPQGAADERLLRLPLVARRRTSPTSSSRTRRRCASAATRRTRRPSRRRTAATRSTRCPASSCHNPHSSAQAKLLKTSVHAPVAARAVRHLPRGADVGEAVRGDPEGRRAVRHLPRRRRHQGHRQGAAPAVQGRGSASCATTRTPRRTRSCSRRKGNDLCVTCHKEKKAAVGFKHAPVASEQGCLSCHRPHSSDNAAAADGDAGALCLSCHAKTKEAAQKAKIAARARRGGRLHRLPRRARLERQGHPEGPDGPRLLSAATRTPRRTSSRPTRTSRSGTASAPRATSRTAPRKGAAEGRRREALRIVSRRPHEADRGRRQAHAVRRGDVPHLPRPARQQRQGHGGGQHRHALRGLPCRRQGRRSTRPRRSTARSSTASARSATTRTRRRCQRLLLAKSPDLCLELPQDGQGGDGRRARALAGGEGLPALSQAACVGREPADGQAGPDAVRGVPRRRRPRPSARRTCRSTRRGSAASAATTRTRRRTRTSSRPTSTRRSP